MRPIYRKIILAAGLLLLWLSACNPTSGPNPQIPAPGETLPTSASVLPTEPLLEPTPTPVPPRLLTVCLRQEPVSLFLYADTSPAARAVREALYDGPIDVHGFEISPVILEKLPTLADGDLILTPVEVQPNSVIVDASGQISTLKDGVVYWPSGCGAASCAQTYTGGAPVMLDQLSARFQLKPNLTWSDGSPLIADDSLYSFEMAQNLAPRGRPELVARTTGYTVLNETSVEWRGLPGYRDERVQTFFFTPLPRHAWGSIPLKDLVTAELPGRNPIGWGPYQLEEWVAGDHISLSRNVTYFRAGEGLPHFDRLVFRFVPDAEAAVEALLAGECDYVDESAGIEGQGERLLDLQADGKLAVQYVAGSAWEHLDLGIQSVNTLRPALFARREVRQALALCLDRQKLAAELFPAGSGVPDTYSHPVHPLSNLDAKQYSFNPQAGANLLETSGWTDADGNPETARIAQGVIGVPAGTPLEFELLTTSEPEKKLAAEILQNSLSSCGVKVNVRQGAWEELFSAGPEGPVFGRDFATAQYGWVASLAPPCFLYTTGEIPGPYPLYPKGWGGANATGYSNAEFDAACREAMAALPGTPEQQAAHFRAQAIFSEDLPAIPLYLRPEAAAMRPDFCHAQVEPSAESALWNLEAFDYGEGCDSSEK